jgi:AcrR family transcriptional regulator
MEVRRSAPNVGRHRSKGLAQAERILDAAAEVLLQDGHAALSLRRVAARAGTRLGHIQYYYPSKKALVHALLDRLLLRAITPIERHGGELSSADRLGAMLSGLLAEQARPETMRLFVELRALATRDPAVAEAARAFYGRYWRAVVEVLQEMNPALGRPRAERRAALVVALLEGLLLFRSPSDPRRLPLLGLEREIETLVRRLASDL